MILLQAKALTKSFGSQKAIDAVDLELSAGKFYALLGHNGAGKSTLMKILMRKESPDSGQGMILGFSFEGGVAEVNQQVAYVSEDIEYHLPLTIREFSSFFSKLYINWDEKTYMRLVEEFRLPPSSRADALSRGQRMQLCLSIAISIRPKIVFVDEATSVLDAGARLTALRELRRVCDEGGTVLVATNIVSEVQFYTDELLLLESGRTVLKGDPKVVSDSYLKFRIQPELLDYGRLPSRVKAVTVNSDGSVSFLAPRELATSMKELSFALDTRSITMEELFIYSTRGETS